MEDTARLAADTAAVIDATAEFAATGVEPTTVELNGESLTLEDAIKKLTAIVSDSPVAEPFDITRPRLIEPVEIILDRPRHLRLPFWALKKFEATTGVSPWDHSKVWSYPPNMDILCTMIWVGLLDEDPDLTLEEVERFPNMDFGNIHYLRHCLDECWGRNQPKVQPGQTGPEAANPQRAKRSPTG